MRVLASSLYDPFAPEVHTTYPASQFATLRDERPVYHDEQGGFWALSRYDDVQLVLRDHATYSSAGPTGVHIDGRPALYGSGDFIEHDPPRHTQLREIVRHPFSLRAVAAIEADVRQLTSYLLSPLVSAGGGDIAEDVCWRLAFELTAEVLGVPADDRELVNALVKRFSAIEPGTAGIPLDAQRASTELHDYVTAQLTRDRRGLTGLFRSVADARAQGDISDAEAPGIPMLFFGAAIETPASATASAIHLLARHPDQRSLLANGTVAYAAAVEELFRYESPLQCLARTTTRPVTFHDTAIPEGATILLVYGAANRDDRRWTNADALDLAREAKRNLAFGEGIHHCLGAPLSRLQTRVVAELLIAAAPTSPSRARSRL